MKDLKDKIILVTGASKGIGAGIAKQMGLEGAKVVVNYATSREAADAVVLEIREAGGTSISVQGDMSKQADVKNLFQLYGYLGECNQLQSALCFLRNNTIGDAIVIKTQ